MPEQVSLPLEGAKPAPVANRFVIPDDPVEVSTPEPVAAEDSTPVQNTEEQAPSTASEGEKPKEEVKEEVTPEQAAKRDGRRFERKLDKAYRQRAEAQARAEQLAKEIEELRKPKVIVQEGEPRLEQFDFDPEKYATAKAEFAKTQAAKEFEAKQRTEAQKQAQQKLVSAWEEKAAKGEDKYDDWQEKVGDLQPTAPFVAALMEADNGEDIAHYLGSHPKEAQRIAQLTPLSQVREIGKLEAKLLSTPTEPKAPSKAPAPITPLTGAASIATDVPSESDDYATWFKKRQKQVHGKR